MLLIPPTQCIPMERGQVSLFNLSRAGGPGPQGAAEALGLVPSVPALGQEPGLGWFGSWGFCWERRVVCAAC